MGSSYMSAGARMSECLSWYGTASRQQCDTRDLQCLSVHRIGNPSSLNLVAG